MKFVNTVMKAELFRTIDSGQAEQKNNNKINRIPHYLSIVRGKTLI